MMETPEPIRQTRGVRAAKYDPVGPFTIPNALTAIRILGSGVLVALGALERSDWFIAVLVALLLTDWLDGKLALLLHQRTMLGAQLDSVADLLLDACLAMGIALLRPDFIRELFPLLVLALALYLCSLILSLSRFHRIPAYHTYAAKATWWLVAAGVFALLFFDARWVLWLAASAICLTNLEAILITVSLRERQTDVQSLWHVHRSARGA